MTKLDDSINRDHRKTLVETIKDYFPHSTEMINEQIIQMFIQWYNRRILILSSLTMITIPIYMIVIGVIFIHSCSKSIYLPLHMIICGLTSLIAAILLISSVILWTKSIRLSSGYFTRICSGLEIIFISICAIGLLTLTFVLISISSSVQFIRQTSDYCHPILYYSSYILLFLIYSLLGIIMIILFLIFRAYQQTK